MGFTLISQLHRTIAVREIPVLVCTAYCMPMDRKVGSMEQFDRVPTYSLHGESAVDLEFSSTATNWLSSGGNMQSLTVRASTFKN